MLRRDRRDQQGVESSRYGWRGVEFDEGRSLKGKVTCEA